ncbi:ABC transporter type 1, transmembrane domain-containing protein [Aspergillus terricola var. indicus]
MQDGKIIAFGSYNEIIIKDQKIAVKVQKKKQESKIEAQLADNESTTGIKNQGPGAGSVYKYYIWSAGYGLVAAFLAFTLVEAFCNGFQTLWLQWRVKAYKEYPNKQVGMYLGVYGMIFGLTLLTLVAGCWLLSVRDLNNTSLNLHFDLLKTALGAPISFFQSVDTGSITNRYCAVNYLFVLTLNDAELNRFGQDLELIDMMLPIYVVNCITNIMEVSINTLVICIIGKYLAVTIPFLGVVLFCIQSYYLQTSRQVRLLDIEAKAPLYTHLLETIRGISSIRSFKWEPQLREKNYALLNHLVVGAIAVILIAIIVSRRDHFQAAAIDVALNFILTLNQSLANAIRMWTMTKISIGAVTRVLRFTQNTPTEEEQCIPIVQSGLLHHWPDRGAIEIIGLTAGYDQSTVPILKNLNMSIELGEKIALCGYSGSGKTSLIMAILQMLDIQAERIQIDGRDIAEISTSTLRSRINVVPQDIFFMAGITLRVNLDPRHPVAGDEELIQALDKVHLWDQIRDKGV